MANNSVAVGSIWNVNSWHWEMKNYTATAKKLIEQKLLSLELKDGDITITHTKVKFSKAEAEVNIRKGKQYLVYDFDVEADFRAENDAHEVEGSYKAKDINHDDHDDIIIEDVSIKEKNEIASRVKEYLKKNLKQNYIQVFKSFAEDLARIESDPAKLEEDRRKREEAQLATKKAREEKGAEKQRLLLEQKEKEKKMKEEFSKWGKQEQAPSK